MKKVKAMKQRVKKGLLMSALLFLTLSISSQSAYAHCDTLDGPVVKTAKAAIDKRDITPLLKWVRPSDEKELRTTFEKTLAVRGNGGDAKELADRYFYENLVRIHRAGEGAPYTGLKPGVAVDPAVALADKALENGSIDKLVDVLTHAMVQGIRTRFQHAIEAQKHADENVESGRKFVETYVMFTHYVEGLHADIKGNSDHHGEVDSH